MKKLYFLVLALCFFNVANAQIINFSDVNFKNALLQHIPNIDFNFNNEIEISEAQSVVDELILNNKSINNIAGIENFTNVKKINLADNNLTSTISTPLTFNSLLLLEELNLCNNDEIAAINCNQIASLKKIYLDNSVLILLLNSQTQLIDLKCASAAFESMNVVNKVQLQKLNIFITETNYPKLALDTLNNLLELNVDSYFNGVDLNSFTGNLPNLYKISFNNITISSDINFTFLNNVKEFTIEGSCDYRGDLYNKLYSLSNLKKLTLNSNWSFDPEFPDDQLNFSTNLQLEYLYLHFSSSTASYLPIVLLNNVNLKHLEIFNYNTNSIFLDNNTKLEYLHLESSEFTDTINLTKNINLKNLYLYSISSSEITTPEIIDLSQNQSLEEVVIFDNYLNNINFGNVNTIKKLEILDSNLDTINLSSFSNLINLNLASYKDILEINLNNSSDLESVKIKLCLSGENNIYPSNFIKLKNGSIESSVEIQKYNSNIKICTDENDTSNKWILTGNSSTNFFSSYCNFTPGGNYHTVSGKINLALDLNSCNSSVSTVNNIKIGINDGQEFGYTFTNSTGDYELYTRSNNVTITPYPNINYFIPSQQSANITFQNQEQVQNFCVVPNGIHNDLEVTILPINIARPGFEAEYKIVYKNNGNTTQSGSVNLSFDDAVLYLVEANPVTSNQSTNNLSWNFSNLKPFETREITFMLNVNSPMEIPAVNDGDILNYTVTINPSNTDETPNDNTFVFHQKVVNSLDPNDKTCLEGDVITPNLIGEYVHYLIRFENTGNYAAQNIVVKDMIDLSKFDISTLVPTSASHSYITKISEGNKVEFIFENIMLPFDDANNDGYIAFKIKTLPTLAVGDAFENTANIFFDYNFPVETNTAKTTYKTLATQDFEFSNYFTVYPNPAKSVLNISSKETIEIQSINIYNALGQLVLVVPNAEKVSKVDVSNLTTGNYFIKINSDKGTSNTQFIKE